jgi:nucleotide-binding universal stress UspA family protein
MYKCVLLPLDGSGLAEQALPHAVVQAKNSEAELVLLRVVETLEEPPAMWMSAIKREEELMKATAQEYLERIAAQVEGHSIRTRAVTIEGRPHIEIARFAEENQVDLIVMCTRGHSGLSRWLMGSVADRVVRGASVPVLVVRARKGKGWPEEVCNTVLNQ